MTDLELAVEEKGSVVHVSAPHIVTERLMLRDISEEDCSVMHELDTNPLVQIYLGGEEPPKDEEDSMKRIHERLEHYEKHGFGRWAAVEIQSGKVVGWAGLKVETNVNGRESFNDLGYRLLPEYWNRGYATELSKALLEYGFEKLGMDRICATAEEAAASRRVLEKVGLRAIEMFPGEATQDVWYEITAEEYRLLKESSTAIIPTP
jgi:[ribosomal protein S5]-alanine N-acetyltransferase